MQQTTTTPLSMLDNEKSDYETAVETILSVKQSLDCEWAEQEFDNVAKIIKEYEAMQ